MNIKRTSLGAIMAVALAAIPSAASAGWVASWSAAPHAPSARPAPSPPHPMTM